MWWIWSVGEEGFLDVMSKFYSRFSKLPYSQYFAAGSSQSWFRSSGLRIGREIASREVRRSWSSKTNVCRYEVSNDAKRDDTWNGSVMYLLGLVVYRLLRIWKLVDYVTPTLSPIDMFYLSIPSNVEEKTLRPKLISLWAQYVGIVEALITYRDKACCNGTRHWIFTILNCTQGASCHDFLASFSHIECTKWCIKCIVFLQAFH